FSRIEKRLMLRPPGAYLPPQPAQCTHIDTLGGGRSYTAAANQVVGVNKLPGSLALPPAPAFVPVRLGPGYRPSALGTAMRGHSGTVRSCEAAGRSFCVLRRRAAVRFQPAARGS